jgi:hypothetical protein
VLRLTASSICSTAIGSPMAVFFGEAQLLRGMLRYRHNLSIRLHERFTAPA